MPRRGITQHWSVELDEDFADRVVEGDLQFVSPGPPPRTVWIALFSPDGEDPAQVVAEIERNAPEETEQVFREGGPDRDAQDQGERRLAVWLAEDIDGHRQHALYAYVARPDQLLQAAFISDDAADLHWALAAWRSLRFSVEAQDLRRPPRR